MLAHGRGDLVDNASFEQGRVELGAHEVAVGADADRVQVDVDLALYDLDVAEVALLYRVE